MTTLRDIRRATASAFDDLLLGTALSLATFNTVGAAFLATLETNIAASRYDGSYIYHCPALLSGGQQRRVSKGSYVPGTGFLGVQPGWTAPVLGDALEITRLLPCDTAPFGADTSYRACINAGLRKLLIRDRITLPIVAGATTYTLPTYVTGEERLILTGDADGLGPRPAVWEPSPFGGAPLLAAWRRPRFVHDGGANLLIFEVPFETASGSISLDVQRPADTLIAPVLGGVFSDSTVGLVNDGDQTSPQIELAEATAVAATEVAEVLANRGDDLTWRKTWVTYLQIARSQPHYDRRSESPQAQAVPDRQAAA